MNLNTQMNNIFDARYYPIVIDLLIRYCKNQERQMNFWLLYKELELNKFSEEEFDKEIGENEEKYVIPAGRKISYDELAVATQLVEILGKNAEDNFYEFFEFDTDSVNELIKDIEENN